MANALLSKMKVGGVIYDLKDAAARTELDTLVGTHAVEALGTAAWEAVASEVKAGGTGLPNVAAVKAYVDSMIETIPEFDVVVVADGEDLPVASADTFHKIYLKKASEDGVAASENVYAEYITIRSGSEGAYTYSWEKVGDTAIDISGKVDKTQKIAGIALSGDITVAQLQAALDLKALAYKDSAVGTIASQTVKNVKATGNSDGELTGALDYDSTAIASTGSFTPAGTVAGTVKATGTVASEASFASADATLTTEDYTPAGTVAVTPTTALIKQVKSVGTAASFTEGKFTAATLTKADDTFAKTGLVAAMDTIDTEMLVFSDADTAQASLISAFDGGSKAADVFTPNTVATTEDATVMTGASAAFTGTKAEDLKVTGASYQKVSAVTSTFSGNAAGDSISATFSGTAGDVNVSGNYDKANLGSVAFSGKAIELAVGDIVVPSQEVTVE